MSESTTRDLKLEERMGDQGSRGRCDRTTDKDFEQFEHGRSPGDRRGEDTKRRNDLYVKRNFHWKSLSRKTNLQWNSFMDRTW